MEFELKREFELGTILSVVTGKNLSKAGLDDVYEIVGFISGDPDIETLALTMQLEQAKNIVLQQHPDLTTVQLPNFTDNLTNKDKYEILQDWLEAQTRKYGVSRTITPHPVGLALSHEEQFDYARSINPNLICRKF